jgi:hypothetical protein
MHGEFSDVIQIDRNISDHDATSASLRIPYNLQAKYQREVWLYKHADFINLNSEIRLFDWEGFLLSSENIDEMSIKFTNKFIEFVKMYIPVKIITIRPNDKPWFNSAIRRAMRILRTHQSLMFAMEGCLGNVYSSPLIF